MFFRLNSIHKEIRCEYLCCWFLRRFPMIKQSHVDFVVNVYYLLYVMLGMSNSSWVFAK